MRARGEFMFLLRFNLLAYLKINNQHHPDKIHMTKNAYDDLDTVREKVATVIHFNKPARNNTAEYPINITFPERKLETIHELDMYIAELNKHRAGFIMSSMHYKMPLVNIQNRINARLFELMYSHNSASLQGEAEEAIAYIASICNFTETEEANFYSDILNNQYAWNGVSAILEQTLEEFNAQTFDSPHAYAALALQCDCYNHDLNKPKEKYLRKSFALKIAGEAGGNSQGKPLWVYHCPKFPNEPLWHITKQDQRRYKSNNLDS
jgi:hypothetical protein